AGHVENAKLNSQAASNGRKFLQDHAWRIPKKHPKWDSADPLDSADNIELFGPDARPRPAGKPRPAKKTKLETTMSTGGTSESAYEAKKEKELAIMERKELEFLLINIDRLPEHKAALIRKKEESIIAKYN
ncbi:hypothetical protein Tco_1208790, partial [Tanacetum coccineum]